MADMICQDPTFDRIFETKLEFVIQHMSRVQFGHFLLLYYCCNKPHVSSFLLLALKLLVHIIGWHNL